MSAPAQFEQQTPTNHVPKRPILLNPSPGPAKLLRQRPPTLSGMFGNQAPDKCYVLPCDRPASVSYLRFHGRGIA
jgi:hypothetical protein